MDIQEILEKGNEMFLPNLSLDVVIIGYREGHLKCLLLRVGNKWLLPGGYIPHQNSVNEAAQEVLKQRTGLEQVYLKFLAVFGDKDRQFKTLMQEFFKQKQLEWLEDYWLNNRFVTLAYYALLNIEDTSPTLGMLDEEIAWFDFDDLPAMWMDHKTIVKTAQKHLKSSIHQEYITYKLLASQFTMPQLHGLHQVILGEKIDRSRFQKKMLATGIFERLPELSKQTPGRKPFLYRAKI